MISGTKGGRHQAPLAEINVTPLVDVMLVMLAIFLVVAPVMTKAIKVELPSVSAQGTVPRSHAVTVNLDAANRIFVDGRPVEAARLQPMLARIVAHDAKTSVSLRADRRESFEEVAKILAVVGRAGVTQVSVVTAACDQECAPPNSSGTGHPPTLPRQ
ncbi:ExbD/TolR family protein [Trinickia dinghuensis]|uniref:Biopolymer transporter ExbD n=1 Tax=Trinickia dinghuensis TaxID=2291023 RepID=A0A3D8JYV9_9BURK|nr:biopolymer transporter ExbD [Trinickia dinghuensis]RDU98199.1 biopolymer transporter ExbD [Trinickia dinghuensis]